MSGDATKRRRVDIVPVVSGEPVINGAVILQEISTSGVGNGAVAAASANVINTAATFPVPVPFPIAGAVSAVGVSVGASPGHALMKAEEQDLKATPRRRTGTKTSVWTTVAVSSIENNRARCALCGKIIAVSGVSSSNIVAHYQKWHRNVYADVSAAETTAAKREVLETAINAANAGRKPDPLQPLPIKSSRPKQRPRGSAASITKTERRVSALLLAAAHSIPLETLASPEFTTFVAACGGSSDLDVNSYHGILSSVHIAASKISDVEAGISLQVSHILQTTVKQAILETELLRTAAHRIQEGEENVTHVIGDFDGPIMEWCNELAALESYLELKKCTSGGDMEELRADSELKCIMDCITILSELRRVSLALEDDRRVSASRAPRLLWELVRSFDNHLAFEDKVTREVATKVRDCIHNKSRSMYEPVPRELALDGMDTNTSSGDVTNDGTIEGCVDSVQAIAKQALSLHLAAMFDVNECSFDWYPDPTSKSDYVDLLADVVVADLPVILKDEFDPNLHNKANLLTVHEHMVKHLNTSGRKAPSAALDWWVGIENSSVAELRKRRLYIAAMFVEPAHAFLSPVLPPVSKIDENTAAIIHDERETMTILRSLLRSRMESSSIQRSTRACVVRKLATDIASVVENTV